MASTALRRTYECLCSRQARIAGISGSSSSGSFSLQRKRSVEPRMYSFGCCRSCKQRSRRSDRTVRTHETEAGRGKHSRFHCLLHEYPINWKKNFNKDFVTVLLIIYMILLWTNFLPTYIVSGSNNDAPSCLHKLHT